jgi:tryptophan synthase alpha chain
MPSRYKTKFELLHKAKQKAFIPFTVLGWPDKQKSLNIIEQMIKSGATALELGIAFSDPVADGPIIQQATHETLTSGFSVADSFELISQARQLDKDIPIGLLVYFNTVLAKGIEKFFAEAKQSGVDGILIADLPIENADEIVPAAKNNGIDLIFIISPVTDKGRLQKILTQASGFLYLVSRLGVTGTNERSQSKDQQLGNLIKEIKANTDLPICAGFGISSVADAESMFSIGADGVITGSQVIKIIQNHDFITASSELEIFYSSMLTACSESPKTISLS